MKPTAGYSTKVKLNSNSTYNFSWDNKSKQIRFLNRLMQLTTSSKLLFPDNTFYFNILAIDQISSSNSRSPSHDNLTQPIKSPLLSHSDANDLKSTSLIMKTIKSANQFDEAMKNLSVCDRSSITPEKQAFKNEHEFGLGSSFKLVSSLNSSKSSSSSSILFEDYATKEDGVGSNMNYEKNSSPTSVRNYRNLDEVSDLRKPIAAPRIKKIGPSTGLSLQLSQLRRIYEAADQSTVENGSQETHIGDTYTSVHKDQPDEYTTELSGSWSRMKARRNMLKQQHREFGHSEEIEIG